MRKDGRFEAKGINPVTGERKSYYSRLSQQDANAQANKSYGIQRDETLDWYFASVYVPSVQNRSENWKEQIRWAMDSFWLPAFGNRPLKEITRADVQKQINRMSLSPKSILNAFKVFAAVMSLAEADGEILRTPCAKIRRPVVLEPDKTALTPEQLRKLMEGAHDLIRPVILLCGGAGLRIGEGCAQTWARIDAKGVLRVREQVLQPRGGAIITKTLKTPSSVRDIPLPEGMIEALKSCNQKSDIWICSNVDYGYLLPSNCGEELDHACEAAGVPRITPHELRHTFQAIMRNEVAATAPIIDALMGHKKQVYDQSSMEQKRKWMDRFWDECLRGQSSISVVNALKSGT